MNEGGLRSALDLQANRAVRREMIEKHPEPFIVGVLGVAVGLILLGRVLRQPERCSAS